MVWVNSATFIKDVLSNLRHFVYVTSLHNITQFKELAVDFWIHTGHEQLLSPVLV